MKPKNRRYPPKPQMVHHATHHADASRILQLLLMREFSPCTELVHQSPLSCKQSCVIPKASDQDNAFRMRVQSSTNMSIRLIRTSQADEES